MGKRLDKKSLIVVNEGGLFYKIKIFFLRLFHREEISNDDFQTTNVKNIQSNDNQKNEWIEHTKNVENEKFNLLKLQNQFDNGQLDKNQLSNEQIEELIALYKKQINDLKKSNEKRIDRLRQRKECEIFLESIKNVENEEKKLLNLQQQYDSGLIATKDFTEEQIKVLIDLYRKQINELSISNARRKEKLLIYRNK